MIGGATGITSAVGSGSGVGIVMRAGSDAASRLPSASRELRPTRYLPASSKEVSIVHAPSVSTVVVPTPLLSMSNSSVVLGMPVPVRVTSPIPRSSGSSKLGGAGVATGVGTAVGTAVGMVINAGSEAATKLPSASRVLRPTRYLPASVKEVSMAQAPSASTVVVPTPLLSTSNSSVVLGMPMPVSVSSPVLRSSGRDSCAGAGVAVGSGVSVGGGVSVGSGVGMVISAESAAAMTLPLSSNELRPKRYLPGSSNVVSSDQLPSESTVVVAMLLRSTVSSSAVSGSPAPFNATAPTCRFSSLSAASSKLGAMISTDGTGVGAAICTTSGWVWDTISPFSSSA